MGINYCHTYGYMAPSSIRTERDFEMLVTFLKNTTDLPDDGIKS
jgi:hypothetical protein